MSAAADQADRLKAGTLSADPRAETKVVAPPVPRILTVQEMMDASIVNAMRKDARGNCTTGNYKLDRITGGLRPGYSWLIGADTSWGKSSFVILIADENIKRGKRVLIVSSEDTEELYGDRLVVRRARVDALRYRDRMLTADEWKIVTEVQAKGEPVPAFCDARQWPVEDLIPHLRKVIREERIDVIVFDYIQEFRTKKMFREERLKYKHIAASCRHLGKDEKISSILCSQLTLADDTKMPTHLNIRECKDIANASEVILIGYEPGSDIPIPAKPATDKSPERPAETIPAGSKVIYVDKVKNGPRKRKLAMGWDDVSACFETEKDPEQERLDRIAAESAALSNDFAEQPHWSDR